MAFTPEELDNYALCGAKKKNGTTCRMFAGAGTDHKGIGRCKWHLGNTAAHRAHATKEEAKQQMATMGDAINVTPQAALKAALNLSAGALAWLKAMVGALDDLDSPEAMSLVRLYNDELERVARIAKLCLDSGMRQAEIELSEKQTAMLGELVEAVMDRIKLTADQRKQLGPAIREALPALMAGSAGDSDETTDQAAEPVLA